MPKFAANLSFLFQENDFAERFDQAALAGFRGVEYLFPYDWPASQIASWLNNSGLEQVLFNLSPGDWAAGDRGFASHPGKQSSFRRSVELALEYAEKLGCRQLHAMSGLALQGVTQSEHEAVFLENMDFAAHQCASAGVCLLIEPINTQIDMPGYWLNTPEMAFALQKKLNHPSLKVQLDLYHAHVIGSDIMALINAHLPDIGHFQIADCPGRHEPGTGEINFESFLSCIDRLKYPGWVGCEYRPLTKTNDSLGWLHRWD
jgi:hydroxypyruvate isomerase